MTRTMMLRCLCFVAVCAAQLGGPPDARAQTGNATLYEGARLIVGDGSAPIENSAFLVQNGRFSQIGRRGEIRAPAGATRVDLTGKTVMPTIVDTHDHMGVGRGSDAWLDAQAQRQELITELHQYAFAGIAAVTSMGWVSEPAFQVRAEYHPNAARLLVSGRGVSVPLAHMPETIERHEAGLPSRWEEDASDVTTWIHNERQAKVYVRGAGSSKGRSHQTVGRRPARHGTLTQPRALRSRHRRSPQAPHPCVCAHLAYGGREGCGASRGRHARASRTGRLH